MQELTAITGEKLQFDKIAIDFWEETGYMMTNNLAFELINENKVRSFMEPLYRLSKS